MSLATLEKAEWFWPVKQYCPDDVVKAAKPKS